MTYPKDPRVDRYIDALSAWQQDTCREVRELVHAADPEVVETIKRTVTGGHDNQTARMIGIREGEPINGSALKAMFEQIIANNRAGGWRELKGKT